MKLLHFFMDRCLIAWLVEEAETDALFRAPDVSSELIGRLPPDVFVSIAVAANLVALCRDPSD